MAFRNGDDAVMEISDVQSPVMKVLINSQVT